VSKSLFSCSNPILTNLVYSYPVLIRPSYVLSGAAMNVVYEESALEYNLSAAAIRFAIAPRRYH
jgi:biotin carboxylase